MANLGNTTPYYGGGQVKNPADVTQIYTDVPEFKANLGSVAINSAQETAYIAVSESGPGNRTVWAELLTTAGSDVYPITPYVVGPVGHAGYQTIQSALYAADAAGGGVVYLQPGTYTENLLWPTGVSLVCTEPTSFYSEVNITGQHTIVEGHSPFRQFGASQVYFLSTGDLFSSPISGALSATLIDCICRVDGSNVYVFRFTHISSSSSNVFELTNCTIASGGTLSTPASVSLNVYNTQLSSTPLGSMTNNGGSWVFNNSSVQEPISVVSAPINSTGSQFFGPLSFSGNAGAFFLNSSFVTDTGPCASFADTSQATFVGCNLDSSSNPIIDGISSGPIVFNTCSFVEGVSINPALNSSVEGTLLTGPIVCGATEPNASAIVSAFSTTQGVLFPNMTTVQKLAIATPASGLQVYDTTLNQMSYYNGTTWINF